MLKRALGLLACDLCIAKLGRSEYQRRLLSGNLFLNNFMNSSQIVPWTYGRLIRSVDYKKYIYGCGALAWGAQLSELWLFLMGSWVGISLGWYRTQKPLKPGNTKKIRKKWQNPPFCPKIRKNDRKITKIVIFWPLSYFFWSFFRTFGAQPGMGDFVIFFVFPGLRGFCILYHPREITFLRSEISEILVVLAS